MVAAREDSDFVFEDLIDEAMFVVDSLGPTTGQFVFEWFGLADPAERVRLCFDDQADDSQRLLAVLLDPPRQVLESRTVKFQVSHGRPRL